MFLKRISLSLIISFGLSFSCSSFSMKYIFGCCESKSDPIRGQKEKRNEVKEESEEENIQGEDFSWDLYIKNSNLNMRKQDRIGKYNVEYIQLDTVNQMSLKSKDDNFNIYKYLEKKNKSEKNKKSEKSEKNEKNGYKNKNPYASKATCPSQAIRNATLINNFLRTKKEEFIKKINDDSDAVNCLKKLVDENKSTSWLSAGEINARLKDMNLSDMVFVIENMATPPIDTLKNIAKKFEKHDTCYHIFIVSMEGEGLKFPHFYTAAICKSGDDITYLIMDTLESKNHIDNNTLFSLNEGICNWVLDYNTANKKHGESEERKKEKLKKRMRNPISKEREKVESFNIHCSSQEEEEAKPDSFDIQEYALCAYPPITFKFSKKRHFLNYVQIETVDQKSDDVVGELLKEYNETKNNDYFPYATSACLAIRNARLINRFFESKDTEDRKITLKTINDSLDANDYLENRMELGKPTSFLGWEDIKKILEGDDDSKNGKNLSDDITLVDSVLDVNAKGFLDDITEMFRKRRNYHHVFIIGTGDVYSKLEDGIEDLEKNVQMNEMKKQVLLEQEKNKIHWYVLGVQKRGEKIHCIVIDTLISNNITENKKALDRNMYFSQKLLSGKSYIDFPKYIQEATMELMASLEDITCKEFGQKYKDKQFITFPKRLSKEREDSLFDACPIILKFLLYAYAPEYKQAFDKKGIIRSVLLYGPQGTGKTTLGTMFAQKTKRKVVRINGGLLGNKYVDSEKNRLRKIISDIKNSNEPYVIILDEADALLKRREKESTDQAFANLFDLLKENNSNIFLIWTTNNIEETGKRAGDRLGPKIEVGLPDKEQRKKIVEQFLKEARSTGVSFDKSLNSDFISKKVASFSIRKIEELINLSTITALGNILNIHNNSHKETKGLKKLDPATLKRLKEVTISKKDFEKAYLSVIKGQLKIENAPAWWKKLLKNDITKIFLDSVARGGISLGFDLLGHHLKTKYNKAYEEKRSIFWQSFEGGAGQAAGVAVVGGIGALAVGGSAAFWKWWHKADPKVKKAALKVAIERIMKAITG